MLSHLTPPFMAGPAQKWGFQIVIPRLWAVAPKRPVLSHHRAAGPGSTSRDASLKVVDIIRYI